MRMYKEPRGEAYELVIDLAIWNSECFVLKVKIPTNALRVHYISVLEALKPYQVETIVVQGNNKGELTQNRSTYHSDGFYSVGTYFLYRCCEESGNILKKMAKNLSDWIYPNLPEDLCFLKEGGGYYLYSVVHEQMYGIDVTEAVAIELMDQNTGLFLELESHRDLDCLLDDAIKQKADRLNISGYRLTELPERIRELTELRDLHIFEQDIYRFPEWLFDLSKLELLEIYTADLESIPASIGKLKKLKQLYIHCGSLDRPTSEFQLKPKEEISLNCIPPEIGELEQLEQLTIQYTSIHELPPELEKLKNLRGLSLEACMIKQKPEFLNRMKKLRYISL
ncbi:leucine-rich repeat domain-containing protein [Paenibacillus yanchengensis]|uniref:Leucine-rich repeat domain-containing protein n=1 Tax=Paenibacillus yanchengensis TaxID=2035833 RepID=A0ABW4YQT5_9BACL